MPRKGTWIYLAKVFISCPPNFPVYFCTEKLSSSFQLMLKYTKGGKLKSFRLLQNRSRKLSQFLLEPDQMGLHVPVCITECHRLPRGQMSVRSYYKRTVNVVLKLANIHIHIGMHISTQGHLY